MDKQHRFAWMFIFFAWWVLRERLWEFFMCVILRPFSPKKHQTTAFEIAAIALHCKPQTDGWHCAIGQTFLEQFFPACSFLHLICDNSVKALFAPKVTDPALAAILQRRRLLSEPQVEVTGATPAAPAYLRFLLRCPFGRPAGAIAMIGAYEMELGPQVVNVDQHAPSCRIGVIYIYIIYIHIVLGLWSKSDKNCMNAKGSRPDLLHTTFMMDLRSWDNHYQQFLHAQSNMADLLQQSDFEAPQPDFEIRPLWFRAFRQRYVRALSKMP